MTKTAKVAKHPRSGTRQLIDDMLTQRTRMLKLLCDLSQQDLKRADDNVRDTLDSCDRAYIVSAGYLIAEGSPTAILENETVRNVYLGEGFRL